MERCMERWREGSEDPEVWSMEDRRLVDFYRITICENGMVVLSQREMIRRREEMRERKKNSLSRKELFAELDKVTEEQKQKQKQEKKQKHKPVIEEKEEENSVENTPLDDDDDDRCLEIAIEEAKQKAAEMEEKKKKNKKWRRGRRGKPKEEKGNEEGRKDSDTTQEVVCEPSKGEHLRIYGLLEGDVNPSDRSPQDWPRAFLQGDWEWNHKREVGDSVNGAWEPNGIPSESDAPESPATKGTQGEENPI